MTTLKRGDVCFVENDDHNARKGSEMKNSRPAIIVSNDKNNRYSTIVEVVFLTTQKKAPLPTHVTINSTITRSIAMCEQITSISKERIREVFGHCTQHEIDRINDALKISIGV